MSVGSILVSVLTAVITTLAVFKKMHILTLVFGTSLIGSCIDYSLHYFTQWAGNPLLKSGEEIRKHLTKSLSMAIISSVLCYAILLFAPFDMLKQMSGVINQVVGFFGVVMNFFVGCVVAVYVLMSKEVFLRQIKKIIYAFSSKDGAAMIIEILKHSNEIFGGFISGKFIDSLIVGILCYIGCVIMAMPYVALISVIIGVTNIIPFFGPYIGLIPSAFLIMLYDPWKGLIFIVFILILQQVDGNYIGPKILGNSTGLSPFWIIVAIRLGGGLFGVLGMLLGVPTFAVIYYLIKSFVNYRLENKGIEI